MSNKLMEDFYLQIRSKYPISYEECQSICTAPFLMLKEAMSSGGLKDVRFKYLGLFKVSGARVRYNKEHLKKKLEKKEISEGYYTKRMKILNQYEE